MPASETIKFRKACDYCKDAKLKCSGQRAGCDRCSRLHLPCIYGESRVGKVPGIRARKDTGRSQQQQQQQQQSPTPLDNKARDDRHRISGICAPEHLDDTLSRFPVSVLGSEADNEPCNQVRKRGRQLVDYSRLSKYEPTANWGQAPGLANQQEFSPLDINHIFDGMYEMNYSEHEPALLANVSSDDSISGSGTDSTSNVAGSQALSRTTSASVRDLPVSGSATKPSSALGKGRVNDADRYLFSPVQSPRYDLLEPSPRESECVIACGTIIEKLEGFIKARVTLLDIALDLVRKAADFASQIIDEQPTFPRCYLMLAVVIDQIIQVLEMIALENLDAASSPGDSGRFSARSASLSSKSFHQFTFDSFATMRSNQVTMNAHAILKEILNTREVWRAIEEYYVRLSVVDDSMDIGKRLQALIIRCEGAQKLM